jgi:hypothetical protein
MAKGRRKKAASKEPIEIIELKTPCDLANEELKQTYGNKVLMTRELYEELNGFREIPKTEIRQWLLKLNDLSGRVMKTMVSPASIKSMCGSCGSARSLIERFHRPLMHILSVCDKYNTEVTK